MSLILRNPSVQTPRKLWWAPNQTWVFCERVDVWKSLNTSTQFFVFPNFVSIIKMTWCIIGKKKQWRAYLSFCASEKICFLSFGNFPHLWTGLWMWKKELVLGPNKFRKRQLLQTVKKMLCGQISKEEKKDSLPKNNDCVVFFSLAGSVENCILIFFVMHLRLAQTKTQYFTPMENFNFCCTNLTLLIFVWKKLCALIST